MSSRASSAPESAFQSLPRLVQRRVDRAFDSIVNPNASNERPRKRRKVEDVQPGGFIVEDDAGGGGGGLMLDESNGERGDSDVTSQEDYISMTQIPSALQLLDIRPDDPEIIAVFQNAASGWGDARGGGDVVSREDWRAVCAVLLEFEEDASMDDDDDRYSESSEESESASEGSDDDYERGTTSRGKVKAKAKIARVTSGELTARQKRECLAAFSLFFPDVPEDQVASQRLMIKDITRVAKQLKEKLKADEIVEMLDTISTNADRSVSLGDFERMMVKARLV